MTDARSKNSDIAVVGMACWYPGSRSLKEFWENILSKRQQFRRMPDGRLPWDVYGDADKRAPDKTYGTEAAVLDGFEFDWRERRIPKSTFESTDIVHWLALEVALKALEDSGQNLQALQKLRTGVVLGNTLTGEWTRTNAMRLRWPFVERVLRETAESRGQLDLLTPDFLASVEKAYKSVFPSVTEDTLSGALSNTIAGRICNVLDLHGGGYTVDGACSSSLLAVITAARNLANNELDVAFAGGIDISLDTFELIGFAKVGALSPDDMRVYDKRANGFIPGEGCGFVVLKRLADAERDGDRIYAVVKGWGISSDGKGGLTAPTVDGQARAIGDAYRMAGYGLDAVTFIEGHGTGTTLGDKVEISALVKVLGESAPAHKIGLTSLKTVLGHTKAAAGIGGFIKAALGANQRIAPPLAGVDEPNELFASQAKFFKPLTVGKKFGENGIVRCGVSAMGFGGINTHVTLESYGEIRHEHSADIPESVLWASSENAEALSFSAHSQTALRRLIDAALSDVRQLSRAELADFAAHLSASCRGEDPYRAVVVVRNPEAAFQALSKIRQSLETPLSADQPVELEEPTFYAAVAKATKVPKIGFAFPGQGSQRRAMAHHLVRRYGWALRMHTEATQIARDEKGKRLIDAIDQDENLLPLDETEIVQPSVSLANALWCEALKRVGIKPAAVTGHSLGELSAMYAAGSMTLGALIRLATARGKLMGKATPSAGIMIYLNCAAETAQKLLDEAEGIAVVANINSREQTVISGEPKALEKILERALSSGIKAGRLPVSNAFHSPLMKEAAQKFSEILARESFTAPSIPLVRSSDGREWKAEDEIPQYLSQQITSQVDFVTTSDQLAATSDIILEVGPGSVLSGLLRKNLHAKSIPIFAVDPKPASTFEFKAAIARCFVRGSRVRWSELHSERFHRPHVSPSLRLFITSPTERPLALDNLAGVMKSVPAQGMGSSVGAASSVISNRIAPTAQVSSMRDGAAAYTNEQASPSVVADPNPAILTSAKTETTPATKTVVSKERTLPVMLAAVLDSVSAITSFDVKTLNGEMRLLDDLNLDSIKLTELVYLVGKSQGLDNPQVQISNPNMSLKEFAETMLAYMQTQQVQSVAVSEASVTPPVAAVNIKSDSQINTAATASAPGLSAVVAPVTNDNLVLEGSNNSTIQNPVSLEKKIVTKPTVAPPMAESIKSKNRRPWVRNFTEKFVEAALDEGNSINWHGHKVAIVGHVQDQKVVNEFANRLKARGAEVGIELAQPQNAFLPNISASQISIVFVPTALDDSLEAVVKVLAGYAQAKTARNHQTLFVQIDDGCFGQSASSKRIASAKAFAQSIAFERTDLRVTALSVAADHARDFDWLVSALAQECVRESRTAVVGFGQDGLRRQSELVLDQRDEYQARAKSITKNDVIIVTGGAKGITAACAHALAAQTGCSMALVGSSRFSEADRSNPEHPIAKTLYSFHSANLKAEYFQCDIADSKAVSQLIGDVTNRLGQPSGIVHGAGINVMRPASTVDELEAKRELSVKVIGLKNLLEETVKYDLKLVIGLGSVIGVVGMPGNSWYGFANEAMDLVLRNYQARHPSTETGTIAYSVWSEIGMGARMGSDKHLEAKGIGFIHPDIGVERFLELVAKKGNDHQTTVTSRLGAIGSIQRPNKVSLGSQDYTQEVLTYHSGVEAVTRVHLTPESHPFLVDHNYKGSLLFPTVHGLEAMAQVARLLQPNLGNSDIVMENIKLMRPLPVGKQGLTIEIHAEKLESSSGEQRIRASIRCPLTGYEQDHFAVDFVLDQSIQAVRCTPGDTNVVSDLGIVPTRDLYDRVLFQGPQFQRLSNILSLESDNENKGHIIYLSRVEQADQTSHLLGDPFARDALLQSAQITIPQNQCLPIEIGRLEISASSRRQRALRTCISDVVRTDAKTFIATIEVIDESGKVVERLTGYQLRLLERRPNLPKASELIPNRVTTANHANQTVSASAAKLDAEQASVAPSTVDLLAPYRPVISKLEFAAMPNGPQGQGIFVRRFIPDFKTFSMLSRSIYFSHFFNWMGEAREIGLAPVLRELRDLTASGKWGMITNWSEIEVLGDCRNEDRIIESRTWVSRKLIGKTQSSSVLSFDWVTEGADGRLERIATGHMGFTWAQILDHGLVAPAPLPAGLSAFLANMMAKTDAEDSFEPAREPFRQLAPGKVLFEAPRGPNTAIPLASKIFETGLNNANLVGNVYFVNYSSWMGGLRDRFIHELLPEAFRGTGQLGEMTCIKAKIQHLREAMPFDDVQVTMGLNTLNENGMELAFEFFKVSRDGSKEKLASGTHQLIWTKTLADGTKVSANLPKEVLHHLQQCVEVARALAAA